MARRFGFRLLIWPTHHSAERCNIKLAVPHAVRAAVARLSPTQNGRSRIVLSRVGKGGVLAIQEFVWSGEGNVGPNGIVSLVETNGR